MKNENIIRDKSYTFALRVTKACEFFESRAARVHYIGAIKVTIHY